MDYKQETRKSSVEKEQTRTQGMMVDFKSVFERRIIDSPQVEVSEAQKKGGEEKIQTIPSRLIAVRSEEAPQIKEVKVNESVAFFATGTVKGIKEDESGKKFLIEIDSTNFIKRDQIAGE